MVNCAHQVGQGVRDLFHPSRVQLPGFAFHRQSEPLDQLPQQISEQRGNRPNTMAAVAFRMTEMAPSSVHHPEQIRRKNLHVSNLDQVERSLRQLELLIRLAMHNFFHGGLKIA